MSEVTFNVNGKEYEIPDITTIENYIKIFKVKDLFEDEYMKAKVINLITDCPMDDLIKAENHNVEFLSTTIFALLPKPPFELIDQFELDGVRYGYLPSYKEISFGEFVDLDTLLTKKPEEVIDNLHIITAIMYRPIISQKSKHNYKIESYNQDNLLERADLFKKKLDVRYALGGQFFFTKFAKRFSNYTPQSLTQKLRKEWNSLMWVLKNWKILWRLALRNDLDGTSFSIEYAKTILKDTTKSLKKKL